MDRTFQDVRSIRFTSETSDRRPEAFVLEKLTLQEPTKWAGAGFHKTEECHALQTMRLLGALEGRKSRDLQQHAGGTWPSNQYKGPIVSQTTRVTSKSDTVIKFYVSLLLSCIDLELL
jgi:hypothetical protein